MCTHRENGLRVMVAAGLMLLSSAASADVVSVVASRDNTLYQNATGSLSNGSGQHLFAGANSGLNRRRGLLRFDVASAVPAGSTITGVTLTLNHSRGGPEQFSFAMHRVLADWGEGAEDALDTEGAGATSTAGTATWLHRSFNNVLWTTAGGDFDPSPSASQIIGDLGFYSWSGGNLASDVQTWLDTPASNFGWIILGAESVSGSAKRFDSRENPTASVRPTLTISYIPSPGAAAVLLVASPLLASRRRR
jgi:hypothetical protein